MRAEELKDVKPSSDDSQSKLDSDKPELRTNPDLNSKLELSDNPTPSIAVNKSLVSQFQENAGQESQDE